MKIYNNVFEKIISPENLFSAWDAFKNDKQNKQDVQLFEWNLEVNIFQLHHELKNATYQHGPYVGFYIKDPKQRHIHKAIVRDRVLHHAIFSILNPIFEPTFIPRSFSCRIGKGTHKGIDVLEKILIKTSKNYTKLCLALKCDIRKFFDSVDHSILLNIIKKRIKDQKVIWLLNEIVESYSVAISPRERERERETNVSRKGLPIGNLTSQLFANIYLNELDQFVKQKMKIKNYVRYTDDFVIVAEKSCDLKEIISPIQLFLKNELKLEIHPQKISINKFRQGVDFLGYVILPHYRLLRTKTKRRIFKKFKRRVEEYTAGKISRDKLEQSLQSYLGTLSHADAYKLSEDLKNQVWFAGL